MAPGDRVRDGARAKARALAAGVDAARRRAGGALPAGLLLALQRWREVLAQYLAAEFAPGRLVPWMPVAFGIGIIGYFTAPREPLWPATAALAVVLAFAAFLVRRRFIAFAGALTAAAIATGFAVATIKTALIAHPVLDYPVFGAAVTGFVEIREERARSDRIVVRVASMSGERLRVKPERVRVAVRKGHAPAVGDYVSFKARLTPPLQPLRPGGYDFARDMYFQRIGASGYVLGAIATQPAPGARGFWLSYRSAIEMMRETIDDRIRAVLPGDTGSIASALITGKRDAITQPVNDAMYVSSLAHVLSISGYHMAVVAGIVFFVIRAGFALSAAAATRHPIKKWAAAAALVAATFYLLLSGAEVATQRSYIMVAIVLIGVMADRPALTFRTLAVAACAVMLLTPEAVVHPSFQMSFAATLALIAAYRNGLPWRADADTSAGARLALWGGREIAGLVIASLVAGLATTPYAAFHFHRLAPYGVLANLAAMPVVSAWVMPMGILGTLAMPFGFDGLFWPLMGAGIDWMVTVALWVAALPGAVGHIHAFGIGPLLLATAGLLLIAMLRTPLRWSGAGLALLACLWVYVTPKPDLLVSADGQTAALRQADGRLAVLHAGRDNFALRDWLAADGDSRTVKDDTLKAGVRCDPVGCTGPFANGRVAAFSETIEALAEDCSRAAVIVTPREAPATCKGMLIDRGVWRAHGASALRWTSAGKGSAAIVEWARPAGEARPWSGLRVQATATAPSPAKRRPAQRDATPPDGAREADD
ncbi:MAG: ComEC/Rec2 family competence protein [Xanthobacteraceae bacterium]|uniref:ComEC/Rec2 family competence protein n=1 Tax=Pseudolabrys sp. TaxID=1960880 RepID=UPI003D13B1CB